MSRKIWIIIILFFVAASSYFILNRFKSPFRAITNFEECLEAGYPVGESYPRQCWTPDGKNFTETIEPSPPPAPGEIKISGEINCLPKSGHGPQTMECAIGLKGEDGRFYGLKNLSKLDPQYRFSKGGLRVEVSGILSTEEIKGPDGNKYDVAGVIDVASIKDTENQAP